MRPTSTSALDAANTGTGPMPRPRGNSIPGGGLSGGEKLQVRVHWPGARVVVVQARGALDMAGQPLVAESVRDGLRGRPGALVLDFSAATFFDSAGASALLDAEERAARDAVTVRLVSSPPVDRLLELVGRGGWFARAESVAEALAHFR
jgi:anti-anti-sigma factor